MIGTQHTGAPPAVVSRRRLIAGAGAGGGTVVGSAALAACAVGAGPGPPGGQPALKSGVTLLMMQNGTQPEGEKKLQVFALFEQQHPGIKAALDNTGTPDKVQAMTAAGTPPDVFWFPPSLFLQYFKRGFFVDLSALMKRDKYDLSDFAEKGLAQFEWEKQQIAMPKDCPTRGMFFNVALFQEQGLPAPPTNYTDQGWTWDRFLEVTQKLTRDKGGVAQFGLNSGTGYRQWSPWVHGNGGELLNKDATECTLHEPLAFEALQFLQDLRVKHRVWVPQADIQQGATFQLGRNGITEGAPPNVGTFQREIQGFEWDVTHTPRGRGLAGAGGGKFSASGGGVGQGISSGSKNQEEAWALLK
ncbi:MAG: sugar ABC transporter substrate-binding protein, partial [Chloroflexota bacterium]|nr:sugar ABC transporter substrate-binding protein [Chloroflexota bacterium]